MTSAARSPVPRGWAPRSLAAFLGACATQTGTVVLLPEKDGANTAVTVTAGRPGGRARQALCGRAADDVRARARYTSNPQEVEAHSARRSRRSRAAPTSFTLYFVEGSDEFTDASKQILADVLAEIAKHPVPDIVVVGHTDTVGSDAINDALALRRAETVRGVLIAQGLSPASIVAIGRGKRELARADARQRRRAAQPARRDRRALSRAGRPRRGSARHRRPPCAARSSAARAP